MTTATTATYPGGPIGWLRRGEAWLDGYGRPAWIAATIAGFVVFWPAGLALLAYAIWSHRMFGRACRHSRHSHRQDFHAIRGAMRPSGNIAFDAYKTETLRRLTEEQEAFEAFLQRLRAAKDKTEFDAFMEERARGVADEAREREEPAERREPGHPAAGY